MKEVFLLENLLSCRDYLFDFQNKDNVAVEDLMGVSHFSIEAQDLISGVGVKVCCRPLFLENELIDCLVKGYISMEENEPLFIQCDASEENLGIRRWLCLSLPKNQSQRISKERFKAPKHFLEKELLDDFVTTFLSSFLEKFGSLKCKAIIFVFDFAKMLHESGVLINWEKQEHVEKAIQNLIEEVLHFFSNVNLFCKIFIVPSEKKHYSFMINSSYRIKRELCHYAEDLKFCI